jgi:hypothetical protein
MLFERKVQIKNSSIKHAFEAMPLAHLPLLIYYLKCNIFIRGSSIKSNHESIRCVRGLQEVLRCFCLINQIWIENVELIALNRFGRRIIDIIMSLIVLVPLIASLNCVEETWFSWLVFIFPGILLNGQFRIDVCAL